MLACSFNHQIALKIKLIIIQKEINIFFLFLTFVEFLAMGLSLFFPLNIAHHWCRVKLSELLRAQFFCPLSTQRLRHKNAMKSTLRCNKPRAEMLRKRLQLASQEAHAIKSETRQ